MRYTYYDIIEGFVAAYKPNECHSFCSKDNKPHTSAGCEC